MDHEMALMYLQMRLVAGAILFVGVFIFALMLKDRRSQLRWLFVVGGIFLIYLVANVLIWKLRIPFIAYLFALAPQLGGLLGYVLGMLTRRLITRQRRNVRLKLVE
jgi:hypothetical protein